MDHDIGRKDRSEDMQTIEASVRPGETFADDEARWLAFARRDPAAEGAFVTAVRTTGIYCRATCTARKPHRRNVQFYATCAAAEAAGFRACKRCRPNEVASQVAQGEAIARACRLIEQAEATPNLDALSAAAGLSPFHFHRLFKRVTGVTPKAYAMANRAKRAADSLPGAATVTQAIFDAGYEASSRFYGEAEMRLGMSPNAYRAGGQGTAIRYAVVSCTLGHLLVAATEKGVCAITMGEDAASLVQALHERFRQASLAEGDAHFDAVVATVAELAERPGQTVALPLDIQGSLFQLRVWEALRRIPAGTTATYSEIARALGRPAAVRAVAQACGANPVALAIPCHRVVRSDGSLSGYRWGTERKRALLAREGVEAFVDPPGASARDETLPRSVRRTD